MTLDTFIRAQIAPVPLALAALLLLLPAALGLGRLALAPLRVSRRRVPPEFPEFVIGFDLLALCCRIGDRFILALPVWGIALLLLPPALYGLAALLPRFASGIRHNPRLALIAASGALLTLGSALLPPYAWDEQVYQIALPVSYIADGTTALRLDNSYSGFPSMPHFVMLAGIRLGGLCFPRLLVWAVWPLLLLWLYFTLRRFGRAIAAILTLAVLFAPVTAALNRSCYLECFIALNLLAGVALTGALRHRALPAAVVAGFTAGMAAAVKATGGGVALAIGLFWLFLFLSTDRRDWRAPFAFAVAALAAMVPFYWRAFAGTGNFLYPFGSSLLAPGSPAALVERFQTLLGTARYGVTGPVGLLFAWAFAAVDGELFDGIVFGAQFLLLIAAAVWGLATLRRRHRSRFSIFAIPAVAAAALYLFWVLTSQQTRFLFPLYLMTAWGAGFGLARLPRPIRTGALGLIAVATLLSINLPMLRHYPLAWKLSRQAVAAPGEFLAVATHDPAYYAMLDHLAQQTPPGSRVMLLFERRMLYLPRPARNGTPNFQQRNFTPVPETADNVLEVLRREKIDYLMLGATERDPDYLTEFDEDNRRLGLHIRDLLRSGDLALVTVPGGGDYTLLKVR